MTDPPLSPHPLSYAQPPARQSPAGVISFVCALIAVLGLGLSTIVPARNPRASSAAITSFIEILIVAAFVAVPLLGLATGILGVLSPRRKRGLAIAGLILNGLAFIVILLLPIVALRPG